MIFAERNWGPSVQFPPKLGGWKKGTMFKYHYVDIVCVEILVQ